MEEDNRIMWVAPGLLIDRLSLRSTRTGISSLQNSGPSRPTHLKGNFCARGLHQTPGCKEYMCKLALAAHRYDIFSLGLICPPTAQQSLLASK
jgi:hypothetical protein